jgi:hypothetical protein
MKPSNVTSFEAMHGLRTDVQHDFGRKMARLQFLRFLITREPGAQLQQAAVDRYVGLHLSQSGVDPQAATLDISGIPLAYILGTNILAL